MIVYQKNSQLSECHLFTELKNSLGGHKFKENGYVHTAVTRWLPTLYTKLNQREIENFVPRYEKCISCREDYVGKQRNNRIRETVPTMCAKICTNFFKALLDVLCAYCWYCCIFDFTIYCENNNVNIVEHELHLNIICSYCNFNKEPNHIMWKFIFRLTDRIIPKF